MKTPTHNCNHCDKSIFRTRLGNHYFNHHREIIKQKLAPYKNGGTPSFPLKLESFYMCLCCHELWTQHQRAVNHATSKPECSFENQTKALWLLLEIDEPKNLSITVKNSLTYESLQVTDVKKELTDNETLLLQLQAENLKLQAENNKLKERLKTEGKNQLESKLKLIETSAHIIINTLQENLTSLKLRNPAVQLCTLNDEDNDKINALLMDYNQYNPYYELPKYLRTTIIEQPEIVDEPLLSVQPPQPIHTTCQRSGCMDAESPPEFYTKCQSCEIIICKNNDITGCYTWNCGFQNCGITICLTCVRAKNGTRINPLCVAHKSG